MLKRIYYPGNDRQPCQARYKIVFRQDEKKFFRCAYIVVFQDQAKDGPFTSLWNSDAARDNVLNRILENELAGVRLEYIRYVTIVEGHAMDHPIEIDVADYVSRGNPHDQLDAQPGDIQNKILNLIGKGDKRYAINSRDIVAGCCRVFTLGLDEGKRPTAVVLQDLLSQAGLDSTVTQ